MTKKIAIKIDVDTKRGYDVGVPRMLDVFKQENIKASFFFLWEQIIRVRLFAVFSARDF